MEGNLDQTADWPPCFYIVDVFILVQLPLLYLKFLNINISCNIHFDYEDLMSSQIQEASFCMYFDCSESVVVSTLAVLFLALPTQTPSVWTSVWSLMATSTTSTSSSLTSVMSAVILPIVWRILGWAGLLTLAVCVVCRQLLTADHTHTGTILPEYIKFLMQLNIINDNVDL